MSEQPYRSPVMDKLRRGDRIVRDGMMLEFIEEELEGQKFILLGPVPPAAQAEIDRLRKAWARQNEDVCQVLGKALGYPWFNDDQANFPDATEEHGVCVSDHVAESLADEAAARIKSLEARAQAAEAEVARLTLCREKDREALRPLAQLEIPKRPNGNAGAYSILHSHIRAACARLEEYNG